ncbi:hypothetical protein NG829_08325 [Xanthomonas sacchari]|uniref:hypothetical protein n=1 Tax=Xanthomonas sacchari TaxID=56458 RepID=UPI00225DDC80|nr:hypothetical protein [Xanthomonas sacchari]UYK82281.1 hypothetical protein NG829_08325 [Xanthomonas sacchari]
MRQIGQALPPSVPGCKPGHHPQIVETHGAPLRQRIGTPLPLLYHIECCRCGIATVPSPSRAIAEGRWVDPNGQHRIPLSHISRAREQAAAALAA